MTSLMQRFVKTIEPLTEQKVVYDPQYNDFITDLESRLEAAKEGIFEKQEYMRRVKALDVNVSATQEVARRLRAAEDNITQGHRAIVNIKHLLAEGCEPTTPNAEWYCGHIEEDTSRSYYLRESWPNLTGSTDMKVFKGPIPIEALERFSKTKQYLSDVRVYSPHKEDFRVVPEPIPHDPVIVGRVDFLKMPYYFEVARWDVGKDLASLFETKVMEGNPDPK